MRQFTDSEMDDLAAGWRRYKSEYETEPTHIWPFEHGFRAGLDHTAADQIAALTAERDSLRVKIRDVASAALKYEDATYRVKTYPSNGQYKRQLKKIHDILKAAQAEFATTGEQK